MDSSTRDHIFEHVRELEGEVRIQQAVDQQLEAELQADIYRDHKDGTHDSFFYHKFPLEIRTLIFSHVVAMEQSIHVFPPKGNESHGFRLSLCDESSYDFDLGNCRCEDSRAGRNGHSEFFNNALFLVSQKVRREALDAFFMTNKFTFTCLYELVRFTGMFTVSSSKIQCLRVFERVDDYPASDYRLEGIQKARLRLKGLKHLELYVFLASWSAYEELYEDGLVDQLLHFALGPPTHDIQSRKRKLLAFEDDSDGELQIVSCKKQGTSKAQTVVLSSNQASNADTSGSGAQPPPITAINTSTPPTESKGKQKDTHQPLDSGYASEASTTTQQPESDSEESISNPNKLTALEHAKQQAAHNHTASKPIFSSTALKTTTTATTRLPEFPIPPLKSFTPHIRLRTQYLTLRLSRQAVDPKQSYYESLYKRLGDHLTDIFMDAGRKYRTVEDVPKLGDKPKIKVREDEKPLRGVEKRGILFMKD